MSWVLIAVLICAGIVWGFFSWDAWKLQCTEVMYICGTISAACSIAAFNVFVFGT